MSELETLLKKRQEIIELLDHIKSPFARKDRYKQLDKINKKITSLKWKMNSLK